ncbi:nitroreductase family protein [Poseidonocella sedimentorum]|uniref:Nitroreductase n=1 Tax=Poseidonocella sedimentorum TaxID=871652 RepID=A0A1I6D7G9_9RHOB|nr:nitroreductase family protein [Poseidonocella sedimentorum]SFR01410.1 Nitroreductase [Poseidonocella sedimentorum]
MGQQQQDMAKSAETEDRIARLFADRYGASEPGLPGYSGDVLETILGHRTVRSYLPDAVDEEDISVAIAAAQSAPSSSNLQLWNVVTVADPERISRLAALANNQKHIYAAPLVMVWICDLSRMRKMTEIEGTTADGLDYLELFLTSVVDVSLAAQNACVTLEALGYGTCYIGSMRSNPIELSAELDLPKGSFSVFGMTVGREDPARPASVKPRLPQRTVWHKETYRADTVAEDIAQYNATMRDFQQAQAMPVVDWSLKSAERVATADMLKNRDKLKGFLEERGFSFK